MRLISLCVLFILAMAPVGHAAIADFEGLSLADESYWNGSDLTSGFESGDIYFDNNYTKLAWGWSLWEGWAYSNQTDTTTARYTNQYSAIAGGGAEGTDTYGIARDIPFIGRNDLPSVTFESASTEEVEPATAYGAYFTNTTYAYLSMLDGRGFLPEFGAGDWQMMTITGVDAEGNHTANSVDFMLADYTSENADDWYIVDEWTWVDLTSLGDIIGFEIDFNGSRIWGVPPYVAMDELSIAPIPGAVWLLGCGLLGLLGFRKRHVD